MSVQSLILQLSDEPQCIAQTITSAWIKENKLAHQSCASELEF